MTEPVPDRAELAPPNAHDPSAPLVQDQGVNAGEQEQAASTEERQGDADGAPDPHELMAGLPADRPDDEEAVADHNRREPSHEYGSSGQDAGSMD